MAISVADNFSYKGQKPLDARFQFSSVANMKAATESDLYDGCLAYVTATKKNYQYDSSNTSDPTTGKWRELQTGGGSGGGHIIEDNGTEMTQRDTLNFVDFDLEDDTQNEKTVVQSHELTQEEFAEIFSSGLPGAITGFDMSNTTCEANIHSTDERVIGQWVDGKPLYQKTIDTGALPNAGNKKVAHNISNIGNLVSISGVGILEDVNNTHWPLSYVGKTSENKEVSIFADKTDVIIDTEVDRSNCQKSYVTLQYTKTTDSAVSSGEKIVGQWIDGKPIFEKIIEMNMSIASGWNTTSISSSDISTLISGFVIDNQTPSQYFSLSGIGTENGYVVISPNFTSSRTIKYLVLRYTKS